LHLSKEDDKEFELQIIYAELIDLVKQEIEILPPLAKKIIKMSYQNGLKTEEIAEKLKMPAQNVRNNKSRAIEILRIALKKKNISPHILLIVLNYLFLQ